MEIMLVQVLVVAGSVLIPSGFAQFNEDVPETLPETYDNITIARGKWMYENDFKIHWPPKKPNNASAYELNDQGQKEWEAFLNQQTQKYNDRINAAPLARANPFCVDGTLPNGDDDIHLANYKGILQSLSAAQPREGIIMIANSDGKLTTKYEGHEPLIESITFKTIHSPGKDDRVRGIGRLNQWVHIVVKAKPGVRLEGLLIQSIAAPLGLPFGEFRNDFDCRLEPPDGDPNDRVNKYIQLDNNNYDYKIRERLVNHIVPCKYRHGHAVRHPTVFAYGGSTAVSGDRRWAQPPRNMFRVHFNWEDLRCNMAASMQFLIMAVRHFDDTTPSSLQIFRTRAFTQKMDSGDGVPYPYHPIWRNEMRCTGNLLSDLSPEFQFQETAGSDKPILYHPLYDACILNGTGLISGKMCPPGPFRCEGDHLTAADVAAVNAKMAVDVETTRVTCDLKICLNPVDTEPRLNRSVSIDKDWQALSEGLAENADSVIRKSRGYHAITMSIAWALSIGIGAFTARFFKENGGLTYKVENGCLGLGYWLWIHIGVFYISFGLIWSGIIEVSNLKTKRFSCDEYEHTLPFYSPNFSRGNNTNSSVLFEECLARNTTMSYHGYAGWASVVFWHVAFITGWIRPWNNFTRNIFIMVHIISGYGGKLLALASIFLLVMASHTVCIDIFVETTLQEIFTICGFIAGTIAQCIEDKRREIEDRRIFPINEGIEVPAKRSLLFQILLGVKFGLQLLIIFLIIVSYIVISESTRIAPTGGSFDISHGLFGGATVTNATSFGGAGSFQCHLPSTKLNIFIMKSSYLSQSGRIGNVTALPMRSFLDVS